MPVSVKELPSTWFDRPQYRPRVPLDGGEAWFILTPPFAPASTVPETPPREPAGGRPALHHAFEEGYARWGIPRSPDVERSLLELMEEGTAVVVTGQQPGFLGGPLLSLFKALGAIAAARAWRAAAGRPCIPVFWVAGEDHDLEEVREARFPGPAGGEAVFRFPGEADRRPLSAHQVDGPALDVLEDAVRHFAPRRHGAEAAALIEAYRRRSLAGGFAAMLSSLLAGTGLLVLDPETLRPMARRVFRGVLEDPGGVLRAIEEGRAEVESKGIEPLVSGRLPLFHLEDGRRHHLSPARLPAGSAGFQVDGGGPLHGTDSLLRELERDPSAFSAGALLRPIVQEECLPSVITVGGAAEVAYFAQLGPLADHFGLARPRIALRPGATLASGKVARTAAALPLERLAAARSAADLLAPGKGPASLAAARELASLVEERLLAAVEEPAPPPGAERLRRRAVEIASEITRFTERLENTRLGDRATELAEAEKLWGFFFPSGFLQERRWGHLHFVAKHGRDWIGELLAALSPNPLRVLHRLVLFDEEPS
ncbi:MAG TPA: bacillithiol biosynthesis BshC [Planctomycetota bacterium]|nr:bacillithiol biosynthesis BshC [Planctomycetota bacterium]